MDRGERARSAPKFPEVHVKIIDLLDETEPWTLISRCAKATQRAGVPAVAILQFSNFAVSYCRTYDEISLAGNRLVVVRLIGSSKSDCGSIKRSVHMTKDERLDKESELYRLYEGANPFETEVELQDRIAELEADLVTRDSAVRS